MSRARSLAGLVGAASLALACGRRAEDEAAPPQPRAAAIDAAPAAPDACADPVAGLWSGLFFERGQWQEYRVELARLGDTLYCMQESYAWPGELTSLDRPRCPDGRPAMNITTLRCQASERGETLEVGSVEQLTRRHTCEPLASGYTFDRFVGERHGNTWRAVNHTSQIDGAPVEQRVVFRRLACTP